MLRSKIIRSELLQVALPLHTPFQTGFGTIKDRHTLLVRLETEQGTVGWGEAAQLREPLYLEEWLEGSWHFMSDYLLPLVHNTNSSAQPFRDRSKPFRRNNISKFGVETALWMIEAKEKNTAYHQLIGGVQRQIESGVSIGKQPSIEKTLRVVEEKRELGYRRVKLKIQPGWDYEVLKAVRSHFPDCQLMADANSSYTLVDIPQLKKLDEFGLSMIEQPLAYDDIIDHATLAKEIETPICLDESICSAEDARKALEIGACQIINVKPARVGSMFEVQKINALAQQHGVQLWCGGMLESDIGKIANLAAASLSEFSLPADISDWPTYYSSTLTNIDNCFSVPHFYLSNSFGSDLTIDEDWLNSSVVRRKEFIA